MLSNIRSVVGLTGGIVKNGELQTKFSKDVLFKVLGSDVCGGNTKKSFHSSPPRTRDDRFRKAMKQAASKTDVNVDYNAGLKRYENVLPTHDLPQRLFDGVPYKDIPILHIYSSRNNTILNISMKDKVVLSRSCGCDGFLNARKGTNLAAQTTGVSFGMRAIKQGFKNVRVLLRGFGPGRVSSLKGLALSGMNIISITDDTVDCTHTRPRKQRRL